MFLQIVVSHNQLLIEFRCNLQERFHDELALMHQRVWDCKLGCVHDQIVIQEYIPLGQRITSVKLLYDFGDGLYSYTDGDEPACTTVGYKRIIRLDHPVKWRRVIFQFEGMAPPVINRIALYNSAR